MLEKELDENSDLIKNIPDTDIADLDADNSLDDSFKDLLSSVDLDELKIENPSTDYIEETNPQNIDELVHKIKEQSLEKVTENIKPNMEVIKYQEVSDDEFFDDFFDE